MNKRNHFSIGAALLVASLASLTCWSEGLPSGKEGRGPDESASFALKSLDSKARIRVLEADLEAAQAVLEAAQDRYRSLEKRAAEKLIPSSEVGQGKMEVAQARANFVRAQALLEQAVQTEKLASGSVLSSLQFSGIPLEEAVHVLQAELEKQKMPAINVIYDRELEPQKLDLPDLVLRQVSGPDALKLLAASVGLETDPVIGLNGAIIGYRMHAPVGASGRTLGLPATRTGADEPMTRVYPLSSINSGIKFSDVEESLGDALKLEGANPNDVKIAFHEKTGLLIVRGTPRIQALVDGLLGSLGQNQAVREDKGAARQLAKVSMELEAQQNARARLEIQLADLEKQVRDLRSENQRLRDAAVSK